MTTKLKSLENFKVRTGPLLLIIMDGVGLGKRDASDGVFMANTPCLDKLSSQDLYTTIQAHGLSVGMPSDADMGNSEVGHNAMGAGRVFEQGATLVDQSIKNGQMFQTDIWNQLMDRGKDKGGTVHFVGLLSDGNVHSHIEHLFAMLTQCALDGVQRVRLHILLDGRDVFERSAIQYIEQTEQILKDLKEKHDVDYRIASGGGRMLTTMDRYNADWSIVKRGWDAHVLGKARSFSSAAQAVQTYYDEDASVNDQFLESFVIQEKDIPVGTIKDGDAVVFVNFRGDRAIEITKAFETGTDFDKFDRERVPDILYAGMMQYDGDLLLPQKYLVKPPAISEVIGDYLCATGVTSFAISETQKYGHVTYFWNGNKSGYIDEALEHYVEIPSDKVQFQTAPHMKAHEVTQKTIELLQSQKYKFGRVNLANGDMVGHTGDEKAIIVAIEKVDESVQLMIDAVNALGGITVITADHGNADEMFTVKKGEKIVSTAHSLNPVMLAIVDNENNGDYEMSSLNQKGLSNIAATLINLLGYQKPEEYDPSLINIK